MSLTGLITVNEGRPMAVKHPSTRAPLTAADGTPVVLTLLGSDSEVFTNADLEIQRATVDSLTGGGPAFDPVANYAKAAEIMAACTTGWTGVPQGWIDGTDDETPAPFSKENAAKLYANPGVKWVRIQADKFMGDRSRFLRGVAVS